MTDTETGRPGGLSSDDGAASVSTPRASIPDAPHPTVFLQEEMEARGWDKFDVLARMGGDPARNLLGWDLYFAVGPNQSNCRMGDHFAHQLQNAFSVPVEFFLGLERAWLSTQAIEARSVETERLDPQDESAVAKPCAQKEDGS